MYIIDRLTILSPAQLIAAFAAIPEWETSLCLNSGRLDLIPPADLATVIAAIPKWVTSLDLSWNYLGSIPPADLAIVLAAMHENIQEVTLSIRDIEFQKPWGLSIIQKSFKHAVSVRFIGDAGDPVENELTRLMNYQRVAHVAEVDRQLRDKRLSYRGILARVHQFDTGLERAEAERLIISEEETLKPRIEALHRAEEAHYAEEARRAEEARAESNHYFQYRCLISMSACAITALAALMVAISLPITAAVAMPVAMVAGMAGLAALGFYAKSKYDASLERDEPLLMRDNGIAC